MHLITKKLAIDIQKEINAFFSAHQIVPQDGKLVNNLYNGYI